MPDDSSVVMTPVSRSVNVGGSIGELLIGLVGSGRYRHGMYAGADLEYADYHRAANMDGSAVDTVYQRIRSMQTQ
ncbi:hypothetical protein OG225_32305 [Nocardia sp. NBC_01377]